MVEIYNEKMERIENPDLSKGRLVEHTKTIKHEAVEGVEEVSRYEIVKEYPNGGKDLKKVVVVPGVKAKPPRTEEVKYYVYKEFTKEELEKKKKPTNEERLNEIEKTIAEIKAALAHLTMNK